MWNLWYKTERSDLLPSGPLRFSLSTVTAPLIYAFVLFIYLISCREPKSIRYVVCTTCPFLMFVESTSWYIRMTWTNKIHYFVLIYFRSKPLHVSSRLPARHQEDQLCVNNSWYSNALCWLYQLVYIQSNSAWWWAANLLETCRGLLLE